MKKKSEGKRASGVLMHVSSLYGEYSTGSFGKEALEFVNFLERAGFSYWQVLPFCIPDGCNSPYKSYSAFAGNPYFIDLQTLKDQGLLTEDELREAKQYGPYNSEFDRLKKERPALLRKAAQRAYELSETTCTKTEKDKIDFVKEIHSFMKRHDELHKAAEFMALKEKNGGKTWDKWTENTPDEEAVRYWDFLQYEFYTQWKKVKNYANGKGIKIIGDIPIYVDYDSCDVRNNRELFQLGENGKPEKVAGVPPDYFSEDGQMWGNPLYDWGKMSADGFAWWKKRMQYMFELFDGVRIDHFRAFSSYWAVPAEAETAKEGKWEKGPGKPFINMLNKMKKKILL